MSDEEVDLNALIQSDRRRKNTDKQKRRQQRRQQRREDFDSRRDHGRRDRSREDRRDRYQPQNRREEQPKRKYKQKQSRELSMQSYAISASGFVSDVSLDDILKLAKGKKIINIKAFLQRGDGQPLQQGKDNAMTVIINFVQKQEANDFIKEYADKKLDGENSLEFQFRRGMTYRPKNPKNQQSDGQNKRTGQKSEEQQVPNNQN